MHYTIHQLQIFKKIIEVNSITKAADEMHLTQPAVSIQLKKLQEQFEFPLIEVINKKLYITDFGREIEKAVDIILAEVEKINTKSMEFKGNLVGKLKIAVVSTGKYIMPYFLTEFMKMNSAVDVMMEVTNKAQVVNALEQNEVDFALVSVLPKSISLKYIDLMKNQLYLVGKEHDKHEIENSKNPELKRLIYRESGSATRQAMEKYVKSWSLSAQKSMELTSNEAVKQALIAGLGLSILPVIGIKNELINHELSIIDFKGLPISTNWRLVWLKGKSHHPVASAYLDFLEANKNEIIEQNFSWYKAYQ